MFFFTIFYSMKDSTTLTTNDIPKWDLDSLYKDPE
jgi:hypothetical protein